MKNYIIGLIFLVGAFFLIWQQSEQQIDEREKSSYQVLEETPTDTNFSFNAREENVSATSNLSLIHI